LSRDKKVTKEARPAVPVWLRQTSLSPTGQKGWPCKLACGSDSKSRQLPFALFPFGGTEGVLSLRE
jgi:hypothetical protein